MITYYAQAYSAKDGVLKSCVKETLEKIREKVSFTSYGTAVFATFLLS
jgi:hypothetical protein